MAAGYRLFALWLNRGGLHVRAISGERKAVVTATYYRVASIINYN